MSPLDQVREALTVAGFRAGWGALRFLPERAAYGLFDTAADLLHLRGSDAQLRANYARIRPDLTERELDELTKAGMRATLRYYCEAFRLPGLSHEQIRERVRVEGDAPVREVIDGGGSVIAFLGHLGNWDLAGAWGSLDLGHVTTVAERLEPEQMYAEFLAFREGLGMTIHPLTGGGDVFGALRSAAKRPGIIPLLADRDLTRRGIEVSLCSQPARVAVGPAALAVAERRPLHPVTIRHERRGSGWGIVITFHPAVEVPSTGATAQRVKAMTQSCVDVLGEQILAEPEHWHMLQKVFTADLDPARLAKVAS